MPPQTTTRLLSRVGPRRLLAATCRAPRGPSRSAAPPAAAAPRRGAATGATLDDLRAELSDHGLLRTGCFINGEWRDTASGGRLEVFNPATGCPFVSVAKAAGQEAEEAISAARAALGPWSQLSGRERGDLLTRWAQLLEEAEADITRIMTAEGGKPLAEARGEVGSVHWFAGEASRVHGDVMPKVAEGKRFITIRQPVGVVAAITPFNFPMSMITRKIAPAIAAGCTVVLKPSELTPLTALAMAELAHRAGIPPGVINIVMGDAPAIGDAMLRSEAVRKIGFTGSTAVGKKLMAGAAETVKKVSLELGGNAPLIVFEDADLERAATGAAASALRNAGQTCICTNRVLVQDSVYDRFVELLTEKVCQLKLGNGAESGVTCGPLITSAGLAKVVKHVSDALAKGATATTGGCKASLTGGLEGGYFFEPTVLRDATPEMLCYSNETFGPIAPLFRFHSDEEAIQMANDTEYGLAAYLYTRDIGRTWRISEALDYGMVGVNEVAITSEVAPFGGMKMSGLGRENSKYGLDEFLEIKTICIGL